MKSTVDVKFDELKNILNAENAPQAYFTEQAYNTFLDVLYKNMGDNPEKFLDICISMKECKFKDSPFYDLEVTDEMKSYFIEMEDLIDDESQTLINIKDADRFATISAKILALAVKSIM